MKDDLRRPRIFRILTLALVTIGILLGAHHLRAVINPLLVALLMAYILNPILSFFEKNGVPRIASLMALYLLLFVAAGVLLGVAIPAAAHQAYEFANESLVGDSYEDVNHNRIYDEVEKIILDRNNDGRYNPPKILSVLTWIKNHMIPYLGESAWKRLQAGILMAVESHRSEIAAAGPILLTKTIQALLSSLNGIFSVLSYVILVPLYMFFLLKNMDALWKDFTLRLPSRYREAILRTLSRIHEANAAFFRGQISISLIEGFLIFVTLSLLGVRFSFLFGSFYTVASLIPYFGFLTTFAIVEITTFAEVGQLTPTLLWIALLFVLIQILETVLLQPMILGKKTGLHPIAIIFSILACGQLFGFFGLLVAVPLASAIKIVAQEWFLPTVREVTEDA